MLSSLITRQPRLDLKLIKSRSGRQMVSFGDLSVTLSNACEIKKVYGRYCTVLVEYWGED